MSRDGETIGVPGNGAGTNTYLSEREWGEYWSTREWGGDTISTRGCEDY